MPKRLTAFFSAGIVLLTMAITSGAAINPALGAPAATATATDSATSAAVATGTAPAAGTQAASSTAACKNSPPVKLKVGDSAQVAAKNSDDLPGAFLKDIPDRQGSVSRYLPVGTVVTIADGPKCDTLGNQWWSVKVGDALTGWMTETVAKNYILAPAGNAKPVTLASTTLLPALRCIKPGSSSDTAKPKEKVLRVIFSTNDGEIDVSDNGEVPHAVIKFDFVPSSVDLSPDGAALLATNANGVYLVDIASGKAVLVADGNTFQLPETAIPKRAIWRPDTYGALVENEDRVKNNESFPLWNLPLDGKQLPSRLDTGAQPADSLRVSPQHDQIVVLSANDITLPPKGFNDEPKALLQFVPISEVADARNIFMPAVTWATNGKGFYTYIPNTDVAGPDDPIAGHLWYITFDAAAKDLGKPANVKPDDYVIPSPDGKAFLLGNNQVGWRIQAPDTGAAIQTLPQGAAAFNWTPDGKGVIYSGSDGKAAFLGLDGSKTSAYLPDANNLYDIHWLPDGTILFLVKGKDEKLTFSIKQTDKDPVFMGIAADSKAVSAAYFDTIAGSSALPQKCN